MPGHLLRVGAASVVFAQLVACGSTPATDRATELTVFAASSLTDAFDEMADAFESEHPGVAVRVNLAGSATLREQVLGGAPADLIVLADATAMAPLRSDGAIEGTEVVIATNDLVLAVPSSNPGGVEALSDLADPDLLVGVCAADVPCGRLADAAFAAAGVAASLDTREPNVRAVRTKLLDAELDAGLVYRTDLHDVGDRLLGIELPVAVATSYPLARLVDGPADDAVAADFAAFVLGSDGQAILAAHGFGRP